MQLDAFGSRSGRRDAEQVAQSARAMTDWTFYVRKFPWATAALAAAAGFLLVPKKQQVVTPTPEQLAALAKSREFAAAANGSPLVGRGVNHAAHHEYDIQAPHRACRGRAAMHAAKRRIEAKAARLASADGADQLNLAPTTSV